jgi:hypothetical protein
MNAQTVRRWFGWAMGLALGTTFGLATAEAAGSSAPPSTGTAETIQAHLTAMAGYTAPFNTQPLDLQFSEDEAEGGKDLRLHWEQGRFRMERQWLGVTQAYAYDGQDYWFGSSETLPFRIDHALSADVTHQFVPNLHYSSAGQVAALRPLNDHELGEARKLPQLNGYLLLDYSPPGMSEAWLLLDPQTLLLQGSLLGNDRSLDASSVLQLAFYGQWTDFGPARYPRDEVLLAVTSAGTEVRRHTLRIVSLTAAAPLAPGQFSLASAPAVVQPELASGQFTTSFRIVDGGITLDALGPDGQPLVLKFDSGANVGLLRSSSARRLGLTPVGAETVTGHGGATELQFARVGGVRLGPAEIPPYEAAVMPDTAAAGPQPGTPGYAYFAARLRDSGPTLDTALGEDGVDGLLGTSLLNNYVVRVDYPHRKLTLFSAAGFDPRVLGSTAQPLPLLRDALPYTQVTVDGKVQGGAFFNTGTRPFFNLATWALQRGQLDYPIEGMASGLSIHGPQVFGIVRPGLVELGSLKLERPETYLEMLAPGDAPDESRMASFGSEFFHEHVVTFDLPHERVFVE